MVDTGNVYDRGISIQTAFYLFFFNFFLYYLKLNTFHRMEVAKHAWASWKTYSLKNQTIVGKSDMIYIYSPTWKGVSAMKIHVHKHKGPYSFIFSYFFVISYLYLHSLFSKISDFLLILGIYINYPCSNVEVITPFKRKCGNDYHINHWAS